MKKFIIVNVKVKYFVLLDRKPSMSNFKRMFAHSKVILLPKSNF